MFKKMKWLTFLFVTLFSMAQQKDSLKVLREAKEVPEKYKLSHFGLKGKLKTMQYHYGTYANDFLLYEFDTSGNLLQITNAAKQTKRIYTYDEKGKLKSYQYGKRIVEVALDAAGNIIKQTICHQERDTITIVNTFNENGFWLSQKQINEDQLILENEYDDNDKLLKMKSYTNGQISSETSLKYVFYEKFIQIEHLTKYVSSENTSFNYHYLDYFGNHIIGFNPEEKKLTKENINNVFSVFILDKNKNWLKAKTDYQSIVFRQLTYY